MYQVPSMKQLQLQLVILQEYIQKTIRPRRNFFWLLATNKIVWYNVFV